MIKLGNYNIYDDIESLDTDSEKSSKSGNIETFSGKYHKFYAIKGNLPEYVNEKLAKIAESKGYLYWYNNGKRSDAVKDFWHKNQ